MKDKSYFIISFIFYGPEREREREREREEAGPRAGKDRYCQMTSLKLFHK